LINFASQLDKLYLTLMKHHQGK